MTEQQTGAGPPVESVNVMTCPWCGHPEPDTAAVYVMARGMTGSFACKKCGRPFLWGAVHDIKYTTRRIEAGGRQDGSGGVSGSGLQGD